MKMFDANKQAMDWTLVANHSHLVTCLSQHSCSASLYWPYLPAEFTTIAFEFTTTSPISSSPGPNVAPTHHPQDNSSYFIQITDIQFGFPSLCLWHKWPPLKMCSVVAQVPSCPFQSHFFTIHPCMKRCDSPLHGGRPKDIPRAGRWELSLKLILPLIYSPYLQFLPTSACPRYYGQVSIISQPRNQQWLHAIDL